MSHKPTPISLITICLATSRLTRRATSLLLAVVLLASIYTTALNLSTNSKVYAAPTPDSCFAINASTPNPGQVTITDYYDYQNNDNLQPACTRDPEIPTTLGGESVTHIGYVAFCSKNLTSVILPSSLQVIADGGVGCGGAFRGNSQLTTITIPNSVVSIGSHAFYDNSLTSVTIGSSVTGIGDNAFNYNDLTTVTIPNSVNDIGYRAFASNNLSSLSLGSSVANIGQEAFRYNQLTTITISNSVVSIGDHAFAENSLTSATIGSSVTSIDNGVFSFNQLTALTIPSSVTSLGDDILYSNPLQSVTYDGNTYTPNDPLIDECYDFDSGTGTIQGLYTINLTIMQNNNNACIGSTANIPASIGGTPVTVVDGLHEKRLTTVVIPNSVITIADDALKRNNITSLTLGNSVASIGSQAFKDNRLTSITIPSSVTSIASSAFSFNNIQSVTYDGDTFTTSDPLIDECYDFDSGTGTIQGLNAIDLTIMQNNNNACIGSIANIPASIGGTPVTIIGNSALAVRNLTSVVLPSSVTSISDVAFAFNQLAEVTIPSSVTNLSPMAFVSQTRPGGTSYLDAAVSEGDPQVMQDFLDSIVYMRIYVDQSQATLLGLTDGIVTEVDFFGGGDINQDGDTTDIISAHLINPAAGLISYSDSNGNELQPDDTVVGDGLYSYLAIENPTNDFNLYYRLGSTQTFTPPVISGYPTPPAQTVTLTQGQTAVGFVYGATTNSPNANGNTPSSGNLAGLIPGVPNTGFQLLLNNPLATLILTSLAAMTILYISRRWARR